MADINDLIQVTFIYDPALGSPPETATLGGRVIGVPSAYIPLPQRGSLLDVLGYSRQDGTGNWQWVLQGTVDPVDAFVDAMTGKGGWTNQTARTIVKTMVSRLFSAGIPRTTITSQMPQFYNAVAAEVAAEQAGP